MSSRVPGSADIGKTADIALPSPLNTASAPSSGADGHEKRFAPVPAPAAALVCVLGLLVLCAAVWLYRIKRRLRAVRAYAHPQPEMCPVSATTVSTVPLFSSSREMRVVDENPFRHPSDADEDDPFDARASRWSASTMRSASTISV